MALLFTGVASLLFTGVASLLHTVLSDGFTVLSVVFTVHCFEWHLYYLLF
jgi:hypothetical protein